LYISLPLPVPVPVNENKQWWSRDLPTVVTDQILIDRYRHRQGQANIQDVARRATTGSRTEVQDKQVEDHVPVPVNENLICYDCWKVT
jgi:hypothetical protein